MSDRLKTFFAFVILLLTTIGISKCQAQDTTRFNYYALFLLDNMVDTIKIDATLMCEKIPSTIVYDSIGRSVYATFGSNSTYAYSIIYYMDNDPHFAMLISSVGYRMVLIRARSDTGEDIFIIQSPHTILRLSKIPYSCEEL